jgi:hypothetical protein
VGLEAQVLILVNGKISRYNKHRRLVMTRKPAIQVCLFFLVTLNAEAHPEMNPFDPVHGLYDPVAFLAGYGVGVRVLKYRCSFLISG